LIELPTQKPEEPSSLRHFLLPKVAKSATSAVLTMTAGSGNVGIEDSSETATLNSGVYQRPP